MHAKALAFFFLGFVGLALDFLRGKNKKGKLEERMSWCETCKNRFGLFVWRNYSRVKCEVLPIAGLSDNDIT